MGGLTIRQCEKPANQKKLHQETATSELLPHYRTQENQEIFFGSVDGGEAGAILLSPVQTCRGLGINPREYLEDVMRRIMSHSAQKLEELLPDQWWLRRKQIAS